MATLTEADLLQLLHDWRVVGEYDGGYVLGRCDVCGREELLDVMPMPLSWQR
jgi:hypothetical protein